MKKLLIVFLALILILGGLFIWKGGHHALYLASAVEDWLDEDASVQTIKLEVNGLALTGEAFWTEHADRTVYGLETGGYGVYIHDGILYLDTGTAYSLPEPTVDWTLVRKLLVGSLIHGRIVKEDSVYRVSMETGELTVHADMTAREELQTLSVDARFEWEGRDIDLRCDLARKPVAAPSLPQAVLDAMVRARLEPPMAITEPLEVLLPAMETLLPLQADVTLGVECGILSLSETVGMTVDVTGAALTRSGRTIPITLPDGLDGIEPLTAALAVLRSGTFTRYADQAEFRLDLSAAACAELATELVPQIAELGITFTAGEAVLTFCSGELSAAVITAQGEVPFLVTAIPLSFCASFERT